MYQRQIATTAIAAAFLSIGASTASAVVRLELRPAAQSVVAGQQVAVELYAVADPAEPVGILQIVLAWDFNALTLAGSDGTGAHPWATAEFPVGGLNLDFGDGNALFTATVTPCSAATASPAGLLITTLIFDADGSLGATTIGVLSSFDGFFTLVWDNLIIPGCEGVMVSSSIGQSANVTVLACSGDGECDDASECTDDSCDADVCTHVNNFDDTQDCCDPVDGSLESLFDGNECTGADSAGTPGLCDPSTGQVVHPPIQVGTSCGDPTSTTCTDPDTCDGAGNCVPNDAIDGNFCEADGDTCSRDRCAGGDCVLVQNEENGAPCDDGQNNCSPGQDTCLEGACIGGGTNPCAASGGICLELQEVGPACPPPLFDCSDFPDSMCDEDPADPFCRRPYTCGDCQPGMDDCPDNGDCFAETCAISGFCVGFLENERCQDSLYCNGEEICMPVGDPVTAGQCGPDPTPPCVDQNCREETCCVEGICSEDSCECVECILDAECVDANLCNGLEQCDLASFTCVPGQPIDCSHLDDQCMDGVCNLTDGVCEAQPVLFGHPCDDGIPCTGSDSCTAEGTCVGEDNDSPDGTVDLKWHPVTGNLTLPPVDVGETVRFDLWATTDSSNVCQVTGEVCADDSDCSKLCEDGTTPCTSSAQCTGIGFGFCNPSQSCGLGQHNLTIVQAVLEFDPSVLRYLGQVDPCETTPGDCTACTNDSDCAALGVPCYCPGGPPCNDPRGVCQTGKYQWGASGLPSAGEDLDGVNDSTLDGQIFYLAAAREGGVKAPVLGNEPLWVTTFEFSAEDGDASTDLDLVLCIGEVPTRTRIIGDGAGNFILRSVGQVHVRISECDADGDCPDDGVVCTVETCDAESQCNRPPDHLSCDNSVFCDGEEFCDLQIGCVSPGDPCAADELLCKEPTGTCVECLQDSDCDDNIVCTNDTCNNDLCEHQDTCVDDGEFCNGTEFCNLAANLCDHTGHPCPKQVCDEDTDQCPSCDPPLVESVGPRYIAITPQPEINPGGTAFLVTSPDWPCLSKYVGTFAKCGGTSDSCNNDADCNACTRLNSACLTDADCMTCPGTTNLCQSNADCGGETCESVEVCQLSGQTCERAAFFEEIDIDLDGIPDGIVATLVDDDEDRAILRPQDWGTTTYRRCSHSQDPCITDADCDIGVCSVSGRGCSVSADDCRSLCAIAQTECGSDQECPMQDDTCSGSQECLTFETCQAGKIYVMSADIVPTDVDRPTGTLFPISYTVLADCGTPSEPVSVVMRLWADADDNGLVNIDDAFITILGFQNKFPPAVPSKTVVAYDIDGENCTPNQLVSINDVLFVLLAFQGGKFDPDVVGGNPGCRLPSCQ